MHHPKLYSWVHKKHHEWKAPIAVSVVYTTKTENLMITAGTGLVNSSSLLYKKFVPWKFKIV
jgi:sterol desaturase/sphingolipid hydroxylase (fatty acid hydroxylase superfamily)